MHYLFPAVCCFVYVDERYDRMIAGGGDNRRILARCLDVIIRASNQ